jgi:RHS repeat-associated protein
VLVMPTTNTGSVPFDSRNRWTFAGATYAANGNLTDVQLNGDIVHAIYDGENRQISTTVTLAGIAQTVTYTYDGGGRRVKKAVTGGATTTYVYDSQGNLAAEYSTVSNPTSGTQYLTSDHLGSTRLTTPIMLVNNQPTLGAPTRSDYLPFGQEIPTSWGRANYQADANQTIKFTGKERDAETGLDYFGARYMAGAQGRFTSPDPTFLKLNKLFSPQRWNLYTYALNNPFKYVDPDGQDALAVVFPKYRIGTRVLGVPIRVPGIGHGGLVIINREEQLVTGSMAGMIRRNTD